MLALASALTRSIVVAAAVLLGACATSQQDATAALARSSQAMGTAKLNTLWPSW